MGIVSLFDVWYHQKFGNERPIGNVKVLQRGRVKADIPNTFEQLDFDFCSLGQTLMFYQNIYDIFREESRAILQALNDAAIFPSIRIKFEDEVGFQSSLIRFSEAEKALHEARLIFGTTEYQKGFQFTYATKLQFTESQHLARFQFETESKLPSRIIGLVGRNGTGKTQYLANLAVTLSGYKTDKGQLLPHGKRPSFSRVLAVSYSPFDRFIRPPEDEKKFSYRYLGILRGANNAAPRILGAEESEEDSVVNYQLLSPSEMLEKLQAAAHVISEKRKIDYWNVTVSKIIDARTVQYFQDYLFTDNKEQNVLLDSDGKTLFSSGQNIVLLILTELLAYLEKDSLVLFDEPEMHLHPQAISSLIRMLSELLVDLECFAILATHSPIIIQEIPSKNVLIFDRVDNHPIIRAPNIETFGENLSILTSQLFDSETEGTSYKNVLLKLAESMTDEQILEVFGGRLSLNSRLFLNQLHKSREL